MLEVNISKSLHTESGYNRLNIEFTANNKVLAISGKSGSGKTTLLRMLAGITTPDDGYIKLSGKTWFDKRQSYVLPVQKRNVGFVFQDYALFPHLTVYGNIAFSGCSKKRVESLLSLFNLSNLAKRLPARLSGGQRQRVAIARALASSPSLLLLDEPLSALDNDAKTRFREEFSSILEEVGVMAILVSHDTTDITGLASRVIEIGEGHILKDGSPLEIYKQGGNIVEMRFTGEVLDIQSMGTLSRVLLQTEESIIESKLNAFEVQNLSIGSCVCVDMSVVKSSVKKANSPIFGNRY